MEKRIFDDEGRYLAANARESIASALGKRAPDWPAGPEGAGLARGAGAFVTLREGGSLRGCIGRMSSDEPLVQTVRAMARSAAFDDPRFPPLRADELDRVEIEITLLSPMRLASGPGDIVAGRHGVLMSLRGRSAVFLPQVATEQGWKREDLLEHLCYKAGLPGDAWRDPGTVFQLFEGRVIEE